jgi:aspartate aminotransferase
MSVTAFGTVDPDPAVAVPAISATLAANEAVHRRRLAGLPVVPLAFGEAGLPVHPMLTEALADAAGLGGYGPVAGSTALRGAVAGYWRRRGLNADPERVVAGPGSKPLLYALVHAIGGDVVVPRPSWVSYAAQARLSGAHPIFVPTPPGEGGIPDPALLAPAVRQARREGREVRCLVVTLPDNPTGTLPVAASVARLCEVARELDLMIIADEIYRDLVYDPSADFPCPARFAPERTIITTALSKSLALGGWRIGAALLPEHHEPLRAALVGIASEVWSSPSAPVQQAAAMAFGEPPELVARVAAGRRLHAAVTTAMAGRFRAAGARVPEPAAAFYLYPDFADLRALLALAHEVVTGADLASLLLNEHGVATLAGSEFGDAPRALRLRVATSLLYGDTDSEREEALAADDPLGLPWIAAALDHTSEVLAAVTG